MREPPPRSYSNPGGAPDTNGRASDQVILTRVTVHPPGSRSRGGTRDSSGREEKKPPASERKRGSPRWSQRREERRRGRCACLQLVKRIRIREARMVRRFCNGAVALGIALTACAAFPRAVMAIDLSRFYGHFNTKRSSGKSTTGHPRRDRGRRRLADAPSRKHDSELPRISGAQS